MINYYLLTKPGIILGNLLTVAAGFILGSRGNVDLILFLETLLGIGLIIASACVFNNYIDRAADKKMERTKHRARMMELITVPRALFFATFLGFSGILMLMIFTNLLTVAVAGIGFFVYVFLYSFWKGRTVYGTAIGSIAGAVPPVVGYCSASGQFDAAAAILFVMLVLWQMPHFFSIALLHFEDYKKAGIPVLPIAKGIYRTKVHMVLYISLFIPMAMMLTLMGYTGYLFLIVTGLLGCAWLALGIKGFQCDDDVVWGKQMFRLSLLLIVALCVAIPFDIVP